MYNNYKKKQKDIQVSGVIDTVSKDGPYDGELGMSDYNIFKISLKDQDKTFSYLISVEDEFNFSSGDNVSFRSSPKAVKDRENKEKEVWPIKKRSLGKKLTQEEINALYANKEPESSPEPVKAQVSSTARRKMR